MLSVHEINRFMENKKRDKMVTYEKVYEKCQAQILKYAKNEKYRCFFDVPEFILGLPVYNINSVIIYVIEKLKQSGFLVKYYFPKHLYITWDLEEISGKKPQFGRKSIIAPIPLKLPPKLSTLNKQPLFPPPPVQTRTINKYDQKPLYNDIIMPHTPSFDLPPPQSSFSQQMSKNTNSKFIKSISDFKSNGKFAINL